MKNLITSILVLISFSVYSQDSITFSTGCLLDAEKYSKVEMAAPLTSRSFEALPASFSLKKYCPTPGNQGSQGSCVGWASAYGARTILKSISDNWSSYSITSNAYSPSYIYNQIKLGTECLKGSYVSDALWLLKYQGVIKLNQFPYACNTFPSDYNKTQASSNKILNYNRLSNTYMTRDQKLRSVKKSLSNNRPIVIGVYCYRSFYYAKGAWNGSKDQNLGGHAMCIVGYDDNMYGGAFEILNSWGTSWGNSGYIWMKYDDFMDIAYEFYEMYETEIIEEEEETEEDDDDEGDDDDNFWSEFEGGSSNTINGNITMVKSDGSNMDATLTTNALRDFKIVSAGNSTYKLNSSYSSGTNFRLNIETKTSCYIYVIGYGGKTKKVSKLYPFDNYSAYFGYSYAEISIPNEEHFISMDENVGKDYLCVLYSTKELNVDDIVKKLEANTSTEGIYSKLKGVLSDDLLDNNKLKFSKDKISFTANYSQSGVVPIVIEVNHVE
jgi:hypothetical protein